MGMAWVVAFLCPNFKFGECDFRNKAIVETNKSDFLMYAVLASEQKNDDIGI
jgi:hypothetical protein